MFVIFLILDLFVGCFWEDFNGVYRGVDILRVNFRFSSRRDKCVFRLDG